jgi:diguanylate cyclase (GGDEF)-like protein
MAERALIVEDSELVAAALRDHLRAAEFEADVAREAQALAALREEHALAIVRAGRRDLAAALKVRDPTLPIVALFQDDDALAAAPAAAGTADGVLVGPLHGPAVAATARAMARLAAQARRLAQLEQPARLRGRESFDLHRRLVLMEVKRAQRYRYPLGVAVVAVDGWREVAPALGPTGRAALLADVLAVVARSLRTVDLPVLHARERFLVIMPHTPADGALLVAQRLCARLAARPGPPRLTVSAGVAGFDGQGTVSLGSLLGQASRGLERARSLGGGRAERGDSGRPERKVDLGW